MNLRQPYVQKNATGYHSIPSHDKNIFSYYIFQEEPTTLPIHAVPDGCVDLTYAIGSNGVRCFLGGTVLRMKYWPFEAGCRYFGVRFHPGQCILPDGVCIDDIVNTDIELPADCYGADIAEQLCEAKTLREQAVQIHTALSKVSRFAACQDSKASIEHYIRKRIYETNGQVSIREISQETGYSECYVRRAFRTIHGISPKAFEQIVRFQNALDEMAHHKELGIFELAQKSGYFDQSHMVKEFHKFAGLTPEQYLQEMADL